MQHYCEQYDPDAHDLGMDPDELVNYLRSMDYERFSLIDGVLAQTEAIGDPALPTNEQTAILKWLDAAIREWQKHFALEEPLAGQMQRLGPLLAALATTDSRFFTPGAHPLHQLLDTIQMHAIGWQTRLGRLGQALEEQVREAVDDALAWFEDQATDLAAISADMAGTAAKTRTRSDKMAQRLIETEQGKIRVADSKRQAAAMINAALSEYMAPAEIGDFLKGPWYDSAQLLLLKFGEDSTEWQHMSHTTTELLRSLQNPPPEDGDTQARRQYIFELVARVSKDLRRWLLSLQHDGEALNGSAGQVAVFHTNLLRNETLELSRIPAIVLRESPANDRFSADSPGNLEEGQWFILDRDNSPPLRARLIMRIDVKQQLVFANQAGIKVLQASFADYAQLEAEGRVKPLDTGASFSRCLASTAGLKTEQDLDDFTGVAAVRARRQQEQRLKAEQERARQELNNAARERAEQERQKRKQEAIEQLQREQARAEQLEQEREEALRRRQEETAENRQQLAREQARAKKLQLKWEEIAVNYRNSTEPERRQDKQADHAHATVLTLPRDSWMGFRDSHPEVLARLAVYNRERDSYRFVDRYGAKVRQLSGKELLILIAGGVAEILESKTRFRTEVARAQKQVDDQ